MTVFDAYFNFGSMYFEHRLFLRTLEKIREETREEIPQNTTEVTGLRLCVIIKRVGPGRR